MSTTLGVIEPKNHPSVQKHSSQLAKLEQARQMLADSRSLSEVKQIRDIAEAARVYAKAANLGHEAQNYAAEIALLAARKAGEIIKQLAKGHGPGRGKTSAFPAVVSEYTRTLTETGTPERTAQRWQEIAAVPQETFTAYIESAKPTEDITATGLLKAAKPPHVPKPADDQAKKTALRLQAVCTKLGMNVGIAPAHEIGKFNMTYRNLSEAEIQQAIDDFKTAQQEALCS